MKRVIGVPLDHEDIQLADEIVKRCALAGLETKRATLLRQLIRDGLRLIDERLREASK
jgi:hypothetical protein